MSTDAPLRPQTARRLRSYLVTGVVFLVPALVTLGILLFAGRFLSGLLAPVVGVIATGLDIGSGAAVLVVLGGSLAFVLVLGAAIETAPRGGWAANVFHSVVESIPGIGQVYGGFREMSETIARGEESFRDVKLVEYPTEGSYTMAFVTAEAPQHLEESVGHAEEGMVSLFLPMGPNPVMGGFVIYVSRDRVYDIDMSVEEGLQAIITSGVAAGKGDSRPIDLDPSILQGS
mgnify:CR=1 FL=1